MRAVLMRDYSAVLGASQGFTPLPVRYETQQCSVGGEVPVVVTEWELSLAELQDLIEGGRIRLTLQGTAQPPMRIEVVDPIKDIVF